MNRVAVAADQPVVGTKLVLKGLVFAWNVNFNDGNVNANNKTNNNYVRAVRGGS